MNKNRLRNERYEYIKHKVVETLKICDINTIPIDPFLICKVMGYKLIKYTEKYSDEQIKIVCKEYPDGFNYFLDGQRIIEYNDTLSQERIRTTIFHEIGHIVLKHTCRCSLAESEAEWFGIYMIAPAPLVDLFNIDNSMDLAIRFDTSLKCAYFSMQRYIKWKKYVVFRKDYENEMVKLFTNKEKLYLEQEEVMQS